MQTSSNNISHRFYLQKDASGDISVPCSDLKMYQLNGVRFIFSQYKKEKLGVILNYPPGCGSSLQAAIFVSAICEKLKRPVLILYDSNREKEAWLARFAKWTDVSEDSIEVDAPNTYLRKQIFLKNIADIGKFYRRSWGVVVVKSDEFLDIFRKCQLKVDFKIWIISRDLKKDLELLCSVYTWINPSDQLLPQYLDKNTPKLFKEDTANEMLLDVLLEDIVFTNRDLKPFEPHKRKLDPVVQQVVKVSKKNKDATGTKIKRSKKPQEEPSTSAIRIESVVSLKSWNVDGNSNGDAVTANSSTINADTANNDDEESKMDVESFIRDNDPLQSDINLSFDISNVDSAKQSSDAYSPEIEEVSNDNSLDFTSALADIVRTENNISTKESENLNLEVTEDNGFDLTEDVNVEVKDSTGLSQIDLSKPIFQKIFFVSSEQEDSDADIEDYKTDEAKTEQKSSEEERTVVADQKRKLEVSTSKMEETDSSFDSKMKQTEERALRKFKGSLLDNIF